jgi:hypothetical protein
MVGEGVCRRHRDAIALLEQSHVASVVERIARHAGPQQRIDPAVIQFALQLARSPFDDLDPLVRRRDPRGVACTARSAAANSASIRRA